jgi:ribose 5-phosphate isomerase RpiB
LATVTVFAVTGITTRGKDSACKSDMKVIQVAEEANNANTGSYDTLANLKTAGLIHAVPTNFTVAITGTGAAASYTVNGVPGTDCATFSG